MAGLDYTYDEERQRVRVNCSGYAYGASIEDSPELMARIIDILLQVKKVSTVTLAKDKEYEYDEDQTKLLLEIANVVEDIVGQNPRAYSGSPGCKRYYPDWDSRFRHIVVDLLRKDPIGAYAQVLKEMSRIAMEARQLASRHGFENRYNCLRHQNKVMSFLKRRMEKARMIRLARDHMAGHKVGDRRIYRQIFFPNVRPSFMLTRYMVTPPEHGVLVDSYNVGETKVQIFKLPDSTENFYFAIPPEFRLSEQHYAILKSARSYMATHQPKSAGFAKSTRLRELFYNISRDTIKNMADRGGVHLSKKELDTLATILTRYTAGLGVIEVLLADDKIQDLYINSPIEKEPILVYHNDWEECKTNMIPSTEDAEAWATRLRIQSDRPLDEANPVLDTDLFVPGGSARFAVITRGLSPEGLGFAIRRHRDKPWTMPLFIKNKMITSLGAGLLSFFVDGAVSMLVAGGRSAGKTSFLTGLMLEILPKVRIVSIEDTLELPIDQMKELGYNIERLKSRSVITRIETEMPADEALRTALRLGDSALIVGEVRSTEAKALYEAMRIGALSNIVAGTIHGESAYGVYDRVVNDLGVPNTSFKATDIIPICKALRSADGLHKFRRVTEITEVRKEWETSPLKENGFVNLMEYSGKEDALKPTEALLSGKSEVLKRISSNVREWVGNWEGVWQNIELRGRIKQTIVDLSERYRLPELLEADWVMKANQQFHIISDRVTKEVGYPEPSRVYEDWIRWFKHELARPARAI